LVRQGLPGSRNTLLRRVRGLPASEAPPPRAVGIDDWAKALIQLAEQGLECLSMPAFFPCVHAIVKSYALALGRRVRHAHKALTEAQEALARLQGRPQEPHETPEATAVVAMRHVEVTRWEEARRTYRDHVETLSLTLHPFRLVDSAPHTSAQVAIHLQATREAMGA